MKKEELRILIAEDEFIISLFVESFLADAGYTIVGKATKGEDVLEQMAQLKPNLVLMDIGLAGKLNGIDTAMELIQDPNVAIIFITGNSDMLAKDTRIQSIKPLASWIKPITEEVVLRQLERFFPVA